MKRNIIRIDNDLCNGCGLCVDACHEGALKLINGKAVLTSESYCDGLGVCLPECPVGAIAIEEREAEAFDENAVKARIKVEHKDNNNAESKAYNNAESKAESMHNSKADGKGEKLACGCPGTHAKSIIRNDIPKQKPDAEVKTVQASSELRQWPVQIKLVSVDAPYLDNANLLVAADCTAYAYADMHSEFMRGKITLIGCPKLDDTDYSVKLAEILKRHEIRSITVIRMEVPCCGGIVNAVKTALGNSGKIIPWRVVTVSTDGNIIND